jgi:hypothetical protein
MIFGYYSPTSVARVTAAEPKFEFNYENLYFEFKANGTNTTKDFEYAQYVPKGDAVPTEKEAKALKDKDWILQDSELYDANGKADISWFNKKKDSYVFVRYTDGNTVKYAISPKISAQAPALKVAFVDKNAASATTKLPAYTADDVAGAPETGYLLFYKAGATKNTFVVVSKGAVSFRLDNGHTFAMASSLNLKRYMAKGATLLFSEAKATGNTTWATAETKYKYAAQKNAPTVKIGIDHLAPLKLGQEYRLVDTSASGEAAKSKWISVDEFHATETSGKKKVNKVYLEQLVVSGGAANLANSDKTLKASALASGNVKLQVRTAATAKNTSSKIYSYVVSQTAIDTTKPASTAAVAYAVSYDKSKGIKVTNKTKDVIEYCLSTTTSAVALSNKWKTIKGEKDVTVKTADLKDTKKNVEYTYILVRKVGDKKAGILSSDFVSFALTDQALGYKAQSITTNTPNGTIDGVNNSKLVITTAGAINIEIPVAAVSGTALDTKTVTVNVMNLVDPKIEKWTKAGSAKAYTVDTPTYAKGSNGAGTITFKFSIKKDTPAGDSGEYTLKVEGLEFKLKITVK